MYKVWVRGVGETSYATNSREFETVSEAVDWGDGLMLRWFGADTFAVLPSSEQFTGFLDQSVIDNNAVYKD